jgi:hypothetical protein
MLGPFHLEHVELSRARETMFHQVVSWGVGRKFDLEHLQLCSVCISANVISHNPSSVIYLVLNSTDKTKIGTTNRTEIT